MFAVSFPSIFSFAVLLHHSSYFFFLSCQSLFTLLLAGRVILSGSGWFTSHGDAHAVVPSPAQPGWLFESSRKCSPQMHKGWEPRIYFAVIMTVDPFPAMYSGHLDASGRKLRIKENRQRKASRKTFELLMMCQETNLGWQCCMDRVVCGQPVVTCWSSGVGFSLQERGVWKGHFSEGCSS